MEEGQVIKYVEDEEQQSLADSHGDTPLHHAISKGDLSTIKTLLDQAKTIAVADSGYTEDYRLLKEKNALGHTALHAAVMCRSNDVVEYFISEYRPIFEEIPITDLLQLALKTYNKPIFLLLIEEFCTDSQGFDFEQIKADYDAIAQSAKDDDRAKGSQSDAGSSTDTIPQNEPDKASRISALFEAAEKGNIGEFVKALDNFRGRENQPVLIELLSEGGPSGNSLLHLTASSGNDEIVAYITSNFFAQFLSKNKFGDTPIHVAARGQHLTTVLILVRHAKEEGEFFGYRNDYFLHKSRNGRGHTALHEAVMNGFLTLVSWYAQIYTEVFEEIVKKDHQLLILAVKAMDKGSFMEILSVFPAEFQQITATSHNPYAYIKGVNVEERKGKQPKATSSIEAVSVDELNKASLLFAMSEAVRGGDWIDCARTLSELRSRGIQAILEPLDKGDPLGNSLLHAAASKGKLEVVEYVTSEFFVPLLHTNFCGDTVLHVAARGGHLSTFKYILRHAKEELQYFDHHDESLVKARNENGHTALHEAVMNGNHSMVAILASQHRDEFENIVKDEFVDLLTLAVKAYDKASFNQMLSVLRMFSSDSTEFEQIRAAYAAIVKESRGKLEELNSGGNFYGGLSELFDAVKEGNTEGFVDAFDKLGRRDSKAILIYPSKNPWFQNAVSNGYDEIVEHVVSKFFGSFLHTNKYGDTPLHVAARGGHLLIFKNLLRHAKEEGEYSVNDHNEYLLLEAKNKEGYTPLHEAVMNGHHAIVEFLASEYEGRFEAIVEDNKKDLLVLAVKAYNKASFEKMSLVLVEISNRRKAEESSEVYVPSVHPYEKDSKEFKMIESAYSRTRGHSEEFQNINLAYIRRQQENITEEEEGMRCSQCGLAASLQNKKDKAFEAAKNGNAIECRDALNKLEKSLDRSEFLEFVYKGDPSRDSLLHVAASNGNDEIVESIVSNFFSLIHRKNSFGDTPLHVAAKFGHLSTFQNLLRLARKEGQYFGSLYDHLLIQMKNGGHSALHEVVMNGNYVIVEFIASHYKNEFEDTVRKDYQKLLMLAIKSYDKASLQKMLPVCEESLSSTILKSKEIKEAYQAVMEEWRSKSNKLNRPEAIPYERMQANPMLVALFAAAKEDVETFRNAFIKFKAKGGQSILDILSKESPSGNSLFHEAASRGNDKIVEHIASNFFCQVFNKNWQRDTPLHVGARGRHLSTIQILLHATKEEGVYFGDEGKDYWLVKEKNMQNKTALHEAVWDGNDEIVEFLVDKYEEIFDDYKDRDHPLRTAIKYNDTKILGVLLPALDRRLSSYSHADAIKEAHRNFTFDVAHSAIVNGTGMFEQMLQRIPSIVELTDKRGRSLLHWAAEIGCPRVVQKLLEKSNGSVTLFRADNAGMYPIHIACKRGHLGIVKQFLGKLGGNKRSFTRKRQNILHVAAAMGNVKVVKEILKTTGMDELLNQLDQLGNTPLHLAAENSHPNVVLSLASNKRVELKVCNNEGFTALDGCWRSKNNKSALRRSLTISALRSVGCRESWNKGHRSENRKWERSDSEWIKKQVAALSTAGTLVATVTFTAGFTVPGGYNSSDGPDKGIAALLHKPMFQVFTISNTFSFFLSILSILSCFHATDDDVLVSEKAFTIAKRLFGIALLMMATAFMAAIFLGVSKLTWFAYLILAVCSSFLIIILFFESLRSMDIRFIRFIPYYITKVMTFFFVKE